MASPREKTIKEEKPTNFERVTIEFNLVYNELLASIRDRDTKAAQQKFIRLYTLYRNLSKENISKAEMQMLEKQLKDAAGMVPSEKPPRLALAILLIIGMSSIFILLLDNGITGFTWYDGINTGYDGINDEAAGIVNTINSITDIYMDASTGKNAVYSLNLENIPASLHISGSVSSKTAGRARIFLVNGDEYLLVADQKVIEGTVMFDYACIETCKLDNFGKKSITLVAKVDDATLNIAKIGYSSAG